MLFMAAPPHSAVHATLRLEPFESAHAPTIAGWCGSAQEALWWAPRTRPPVRACDVCEWARPGHEQFCLFEAGAAGPVGYGELNVLSAATAQYWLGHLIIAPASRGRGYGAALSRLLVRRAVAVYAARRVTLVVFAENVAARRSYHAAGLREDGTEVHDFPIYGQTVALIRMSVAG